eukprot:1105596-Pelagomonas_calceolata.AAC.4
MQPTHRVGPCTAWPSDRNEGAVPLGLEVVHAEVAVLDVVQRVLVGAVGWALTLQLEYNHAPVSSQGKLSGKKQRLGSRHFRACENAMDSAEQAHHTSTDM